MELLAYGATGYGDELLFGLGLTLFLAVTSFVGSLIFGMGLSMLAISPYWAVSAVWRVYRSVFMSLPSVLVIFFIFFNAPAFLGLVFGTAIDVTPTWAGIIALTLVYAAYVGEVFRGAFGNIPRGQYEAALALGVRRWPRWRSIILPQAFRLALPGLGNIWMIIIKDTALVSLVGLGDIVRQASVAANSTQEPFLFYVTALVAFLVVGGLSHLLIRRIEEAVSDKAVRPGGPA